MKVVITSVADPDAHIRHEIELGSCPRVGEFVELPNAGQTEHLKVKSVTHRVGKPPLVKTSGFVAR